MSNVALCTPRLHLRALCADTHAHAALYRALYTCPKVMATVMAPLSVDAADAGFASACRHNRRTAPGHRFWAAQPRTMGSAMALAALLRNGATAEFGVLVRAEAWRQRIAREVVDALVVHAFTGMGLELLTVERADDRQASVVDRLVAPAGFRRVASSRPGRCQWALTQAEWQARLCAGVGISSDGE